MEYIYCEIKKELQNRISKGLYKPAEKIPSERVLAEEFDVSRMTIRQAILALEKEGIVYREKGRGTFVSSHQLSQLNLKSFTETLKNQGYSPKTEIIETSIVHHLGDISRDMGVEADTKFYKIKPLRLGDEMPLAYETVYIPIGICENLFENDLSHSLYDLLTDKYGIEIDSASYNIDALVSNRILMKVFSVEKTLALLKINGITYDVNGASIMYEESYYRSDIYNYKVDIYKRGK